MNVFLGGPAHGIEVRQELHHLHLLYVETQRARPSRTYYTHMCYRTEGGEEFDFWMMAGTDLHSFAQMAVDALRKAGKVA